MSSPMLDRFLRAFSRPEPATWRGATGRQDPRAAVVPEARVWGVRPVRRRRHPRSGPGWVLAAPPASVPAASTRTRDLYPDTRAALLLLTWPPEGPADVAVPFLVILAGMLGVVLLARWWRNREGR